MKNFFFKCAVFLLLTFLRKNPINPNQLKVLILSTTGLGDTLWATPAMQKIKKKYPNSYLAVLTTKFGKEVLLGNPNIDQIYTLEKLFSFPLVKLWKKLKKEHFQIVFQFHTSQRYALPLVATIGAEKIVGTKGLCKGLDSLLTDSFSKEDEHEIDRRLKLLQSIHIQAKRFPPEYFFHAEEKIRVKQSKLSIAMHPKAKDPFKCWPISSFIELGRLFEKNFDCKIYVTGTSGEKDWVDKITKNLKTAESICALPLREFATFLSKMDLLVANDTGPMHLGAALHIKTIGLFSSTNPKYCGPTSKSSIVIYKAKTCTPCLKRRCTQPFCFYQISPEEVFSESKILIEQILKGV